MGLRLTRVKLPGSKIATCSFAAPACAVCGRDWDDDDGHPVPTVYTLASIEAGDPPVPICDYCVEEHEPELFHALLVDRRRFYAS